MDRSHFILCCVIKIAAASTALSGCSATRPALSVPWLAARQPQIDQQSEFVCEWNSWADRSLQNGDIVFMRGDCYILMNTVNFSNFSTDLAASRFSHIGLVAIENDQAYVYDIRNQGCMRTRLGDLLADKMLHQLAIKRHCVLSHEALAGTASFCRKVFEQREKFDSEFQLDNDRYYCAELVEAAYRSVGGPLSDPIAIRDLPNFDKHPRQIQFVRAVSRIEPDQAVILPGNDQFGIWANPNLDLILDLPDTKVRPSHGN